MMQNFFLKKRSLRSRRAFTLIEVLIAASIFTIVSLIAINVFVNVIRVQRRVSLENAVNEDARVMMERIAREVRANTVDFEEYYNKAADFEMGLFGMMPGLDLYGPKHNPYGNRYGCYAKRFYNPGTKPGDANLNGPENGGFGAFCNDGVATPETSPDCVVDKRTLDKNTGQNPFIGYSTLPLNGDPKVANAFCDQNQAGAGDNNCSNDEPNHNLQNELYLINAKGTQKTFLARKEITNGLSPEHALALLRLSGQDQDKDGVTEVWRACNAALDPKNTFCCATGFDCSDPAMKTIESTLLFDANLYKGFVPISPTRSNVVALKFLVAPLEDPRKGFAETDSVLNVQQQPRVTILLTVQPSQESLSGFDGKIPSVTLQTTVTSRVYNEVKSYYIKAGTVCENYSPA